MPSLIFLCVANSARSQMAEGLGRAGAPPGWRVFSAGSQPTAVNPLAVAVMRDVGIDISDHRSKGLNDVPIAEADFVVTLCAEEECPVAYTRARRLSWPLPDPAAAPPTEQREAFRAARDAIADRLRSFWHEARTQP